MNEEVQIQRNINELNEEQDESFKSWNTEELKFHFEKLEEKTRDNYPLLSHTQGYIGNYVSGVFGKTSKFRVQVIIINGYICGAIVLYLITFSLKFPTNSLIAISSVSLLSNLIFLFEAHYLIYYRKQPKWVYLFDISDIILWFVTLLNFLELFPGFYKKVTHLTYILHPVICLIFFLLFNFWKKDYLETSNIILAHCDQFKIVFSFYRSLILMKIMDIGLEMKLIVIFIPVILCLLVTSGFSLFFALYGICKGFHSRIEKDLFKMGLIVAALSSSHIFLIFKLEDFFRKGEFKWVLIPYWWIVMIIITFLLFVQGVIFNLRL